MSSSSKGSQQSLLGSQRALQKPPRPSRVPLITITCSGEGLGDDQGKHKRPEQHTMTRPRSKTLQWRPARLASSRGYVFSGAAPSGASGSGEGMRVCRELPASSCRPTPDHRGRGQLRRPLSARAPPPRPRPLRGDPAI